MAVRDFVIAEDAVVFYNLMESCISQLFYVGTYTLKYIRFSCTCLELLSHYNNDPLAARHNQMFQRSASPV